jgi:hypothetical protein
MAVRVNDKTITILINEVVIIKIAGAREITVNKIRICKLWAISVGVSAGSTPT